MRIRQTLVLLGAIGVALAVPAAAAAQEYPAPPANISVSDTTVAPGGAVVFAAAGGFIPGEPIVVSVTYGSSGNANAAGMSGAALSDMGQTASSTAMSAAAVAAQGMTTQTTANANGGFSVELTLTQAGTATLSATGLQSGVTVTRTVTVSSAYADSGGLPVTGGSGLRLALQVGGAATALFLGGMMLWLSTDRRRRNSVKA